MIMENINRKTIVEYSFVTIEEHENLEDGSANLQLYSNQGTIEEFLNSLRRNSKIKGISITDIDFTIIKNKIMKNLNMAKQ